MSFSFFILVSNFQVCCVWTLISKAILKHIKSEGKKKKTRGSLLWQGLLLGISFVTTGSAAERELEKNKVGEEKLCARETVAHTCRPPPSWLEDAQVTHPGVFSCFLLEQAGWGSRERSSRKQLTSL